VPRVPIYNEPQVQARGVPVVRQSQISTSVPNGLQNLARGVAGVADALQREADYADELRVEEQVNALRERQLDLTLGQQNGFVNVKGRNVLPGDDGMPLSRRYGQQFDTTVQELEAGLASDRQKQLFRRYAERAGLEFRGALMRHENQEIDAWRKGVVDGVISVEAENAAKNWNNPEAIDLSRGRIDLNIARLREAEGLPADQVYRIRNEAMSRLHSGVLDQMIGNKRLSEASAYLKQYGEEIAADTALKARTLIEKEGDQLYAMNAANRVFQRAAPRIDPDDFIRLENLVAMQESGGRERDAAGNLITSPKGARGKMQVMPGTERDPGFGVTPARDDSDEERTRVGRDYLAAMLKRYGGDVAQALAAYNAGPGALDDALKKAENDGNPGEWLSYMPRETQDYVPSILSQYQSGGGRPSKPTLAELDAELRADPVLAAKPAVLKQAREALKERYDMQDKAAKQREEEAEGEVYRQLVANGGDFQALPASLRASMDPTKLDTAMAFAARLRRGEETVTNPALYQRLSGDPKFLATMTDNQFYALRKDLSETDFKHFANERAKAQGKTVTSPEDLNTEALNRALNMRLQTMGIDPTPQDGTSGAARVGAIRQFVTRAVLDAQKQAGKKLTDAEVIRTMDGLFAESTQLRGFFGGVNNVALLSMKPSDVPSDAKRQIKEAFKRAGAPEPTDVEILQVYWARRFDANRSALSRAKAPQAPNPFDQIPR